MSLEAPQQIQKKMRINWRIKAEDLLAILILVILTLGIALYLQFIIMSGLYNAEEISLWPLLR